MYNNDYIIAVDENGQPYIAHAFGDGLRKKWGELTGRATTYVQKIKRPDGTFRYIYDTAKKAGKKAWGSKVGRFIDEHDAGVSERLMARRASRKARQAAKSGDRAAEKYYAHRSKELNQEFARERKAARENIRRRTEPIRTAAKNAYGYDDQERYEQARKRYLDLQQTAKKYPDSVSKEELERRKKDMLDLQKKYMRTGKGVVDYLKARRVYRNANKK